jgi:hypothetical protein
MRGRETRNVRRFADPTPAFPIPASFTVSGPAAPAAAPP